MMGEKPLDRLNYFNGQRLEASDLKLEQQYHIRVRRWLNKSLYSPGIASDLEVTPDSGQPMNVIVSPGLALDGEGREIILLDQVSVPVVGVPSSTPGVVHGNYLTIQYNEQVIEEQQDGCVVQPSKKNGCGCGGNSLAWGGPARLRTQPILGWSDFLPSGSAKIILAQVELDNKCNVVSVHREVRKYVGAASEVKVKQYALEGARDFDSTNPQRIYFHIRGRRANFVTLYLRAEKFSTLYYTELGQHKHTGNVEITPPIFHPDPANPDKYKHSHNFGPLSTGDGVNPDGGHPGKHDLVVAFDLENVASGWLRIAGFNLGPSTKFENILPYFSPTDNNGKPFVAQIGGGGHSHTILAATTGKVNPFSDDDHTHKIDMASMGNAGVTDVNADTGRPARTYLDDMQVWIDDVDQTKNIQDQLLNSRPATENWNKLGDGTASHPLVVNGTGDIKLDFLPLVSFVEGEHCIELRIASGGGRILYNLYVE